MKSQPKASGKAASKLISETIAGLGDWRGETLAKMRALIKRDGSYPYEQGTTPTVRVTVTG